jgi:hypothetical protein
VHNRRLQFCFPQESYIIFVLSVVAQCNFIFFLQETSDEVLKEEHERLKVEIEKLRSSLMSREKVVCNLIIIFM